MSVASRALNKTDVDNNEIEVLLKSAVIEILAEGLQNTVDLVLP